MKELSKEEINNKIEGYLQDLADKLEPVEHCCECEAGIPHFVCITYPNCKCKSKDPEERRKWLEKLK